MKKEVYSIYNAIVLTITSIFILLLWYILSFIKIPSEWSDKIYIIYFIKILLEYFGSFGFYKFITFSLHKLAQKCNFIKKIVLGNSFLDGIWIGYYVGASGKVRYYVEYYEQDLDGLQIRGQSFTEDLKFHSTWTSTSSNIISEKGKLIYTYEAEGCNDNTNTIGCASFDFQRNSNSKFPVILRGFSIDVQFEKRVQSYERKLSKNEICNNSNHFELAKEEVKNDPFNLRERN